MFEKLIHTIGDAMERQRPSSNEEPESDVHITITGPKLRLLVECDACNNNWPFLVKFLKSTHDPETTNSDEVEQRTALKAGMVLVAVGDENVSGMTYATVPCCPFFLLSF